jgi:uncharacterized protein (TIGR03118 family)
MTRTIHRASLAAATLVLACGAAAQPYRVTNLVSNGSVPAAHIDPALVNAWGIAFNPMGFVWVANEGTGVSTLYDGNGVPQSLVVNIPSVPESSEPGSPTGIAFSGGKDFVVSNGTASGPARFIFATTQGTISAWAPNVDLNHAIIVIDDSKEDAIYLGLTLAAVGAGHRLYAADFHNARVEMYDGSFDPIKKPGAFIDPGLPKGFAPFGIQAIGDRIYVTYAMQDAKAEEEVTGPGLGYVNVFDVDGAFVARVASRGSLNAPWGVALAPAHFGAHSNQLLIGNFGDGKINAFSRAHDSLEDHRLRRRPEFQFAGPLRSGGQAIRIDGLWGIAFGNGLNNQPANTLFFGSGPDDEEGGLYGRIDPPGQH